MRVSKGALLVIVALLVPIVVEFRTALTWVGIELSILESVALGSAIVLAVMLWAAWPPDGDVETEPSGSN